MPTPSTPRQTRSSSGISKFKDRVDNISPDKVVSARLATNRQPMNHGLPTPVDTPSTPGRLPLYNESQSTPSSRPTVQRQLETSERIPGGFLSQSPDDDDHPPRLPMKRRLPPLDAGSAPYDSQGNVQVAHLRRLRRYQEDDALSASNLFDDEAVEDPTVFYDTNGVLRSVYSAHDDDEVMYEDGININAYDLNDGFLVPDDAPIEYEPGMSQSVQETTHTHEDDLDGIDNSSIAAPSNGDDNNRASASSSLGSAVEGRANISHPAHPGQVFHPEDANRDTRSHSSSNPLGERRQQMTRFTRMGALVGRRQTLGRPMGYVSGPMMPAPLHRTYQRPSLPAQQELSGHSSHFRDYIDYHENTAFAPRPVFVGNGHAGRGNHRSSYRMQDSNVQNGASGSSAPGMMAITQENDHDAGLNRLAPPLVETTTLLPPVEVAAAPSSTTAVPSVETTSATTPKPRVRLEVEANSTPNDAVDKETSSSTVPENTSTANTSISSGNVDAAKKKVKRRFGDVVSVEEAKKNVLESDPDVIKITEKPSQCGVTRRELWDDLLADDYPALANDVPLIRGTVLSWSRDRGLPLMRMSNWSAYCPDLDFDLAMSLVQFVRCGFFMNPSRASYDWVWVRLQPATNSYGNAINKYQAFVDGSTERHVVWVTTIRVTESYLHRSGGNKVVRHGVQGLCLSQEAERMLAFFSMIFARQDMVGQIRRNVVEFSTRDPDPNIATSASAREGPVWDQSSLAFEEDVPIFDARNTPFDPKTSLQEIDKFLPRFAGEVPENSFLTVGYTAVAWTNGKDNKWKIGFNLLFGILAGTP